MQHHIAPDNQIERFGIAEGFNRHLAEQHVAEPLLCGPSRRKFDLIERPLLRRVPAITRQGGRSEGTVR